MYLDYLGRYLSYETYNIAPETPLSRSLSPPESLDPGTFLEPPPDPYLFRAFQDSWYRPFQPIPRIITLLPCHDNYYRP